MSEEETKFQKRQTAYKIRIKDILSSRYIKTEGFNPNYLEINGQEVSRVNILGVIVQKGLIDISLVEDLFSQRIIWLWENKHQHLINDIRKLTDDPTQYDHIEYLYRELKKRQQQATPST